MIYLKNVKKEKNKIIADYYPEWSTDYKKISYDLNEKKFQGELVGFEYETISHLRHAKSTLIDMANNKREIEDCKVMWY